MTGYSPRTFNSLTTSPNICVYIGEIGILKGSYVWLGLSRSAALKKKVSLT